MEKRTVVYDSELQVEAYRLEGVVQRFPNHFHDYYVLGFIEQGQRQLSCKNREYQVQPGDLLLFNPLENHACRQMGEDGLDYRCLNIKKERMMRAVAEISGKAELPEFSPNVVVGSDLVPPLRELHQMLMDKRPGFRKEELLCLIIGQLLEDSSVSAPAPPISEEVQRACSFLEKHYARTITLQELGELCGWSKYTLLRHFIRQRGVTPYQYLENLRVSRAKQLLEQGMEPLEAAMQTGFSDQSHFTRFFKNFIGLTPKMYQRIFLEEHVNEI